jgi:plastocyanin
MQFITLAQFLLGMILITGFLIMDVSAEEYLVNIPFGAYNPELNTPAEEWYSPSKITIKIDDTVTWYNDDREGHTVTSGMGSGRFGWMGDDYGTPDGLFDSGRFMPNESWSYTFSEIGSFPYFCKIHPWMEGIVIVEPAIPDYPHDATGQRLEMPALMYTPDFMIEVNLTWEPNVIKTHELVKFIYQFYDPQTNSNLAKMHYDFIIYQNGKELYRDSGINQIGGDYRNFVFEEPGSIIIRFENIRNPNILAEGTTVVQGEISNKATRSVDFTTVVYDNTEKSSHEAFHIKPAQRLEFYYEMAMLFILIPAAMFIGILLWMKKKPKIPQGKPGAVKI